MKYLTATIFHLLPFIPLAFHYYYVAVAIALLVGLAYIKVQKLRALEAEEMRKFGKAEKTIRPALEFWEKLTFLKRSGS